MSAIFSISKPLDRVASDESTRALGALLCVSLCVPRTKAGAMPTPYHYGPTHKTLQFNGLFRLASRRPTVALHLGVRFSGHYARMPRSSCPLLTHDRGIRLPVSSASAETPRRTPAAQSFSPSCIP